MCAALWRSPEILPASMRDHATLAAQACGRPRPFARAHSAFHPPHHRRSRQHRLMLADLWRLLHSPISLAFSSESAEAGQHAEWSQPIGLLSDRRIFSCFPAQSSADAGQFSRCQSRCRRTGYSASRPSTGPPNTLARCVPHCTRSALPVLIAARIGLSSAIWPGRSGNRTDRDLSADWHRDRGTVALPVPENSVYLFVVAGQHARQDEEWGSGYACFSCWGPARGAHRSLDHGENQRD